MTNIDEQIRGLFNKLNARKAKVNELKATIAKGWITNGGFRLLGSTSTTNIQTAPIEVIVEVATQLELLSTATASAATKLGLEPNTKIQGATVANWYSDLNKRVATINLRDEEAEIARLEGRLNQVLSPEERRRIEVELLLKEV